MSLQSDVVAYYACETGPVTPLVDQTANDIDLNRSGSTTFGAGLINNCRTVSGGSFFSLSHPALLSPGSGTVWIHGWFKLPGTTVGTVNGLFGQWAASTTGEWCCRLVNVASVWNIRFAAVQSGGTEITIDAPGPTDGDTSWHYYAAGWDPTTGKVWAVVDNGTRVWSSGTISSIRSSSDAFFACKLNISGVDQPYTGSIDETGIHVAGTTPSNTALTWLYNGGSGRSYDDLAGYTDPGDPEDSDSGDSGVPEESDSADDSGCFLNGLEAFYEAEEASGDLIDGYTTLDFADENNPGTTTGIVGDARTFDSDLSQWFERAHDLVFAPGYLLEAAQSFWIAGWVILPAANSVASGTAVGIMAKGLTGISADIEEWVVWAVSSGTPQRWSIWFRATNSSGSAGIATTSQQSLVDPTTGIFFLVGWDAVSRRVFIKLNGSTLSFSSAIADADWNGLQTTTGPIRIGNNVTTGNNISGQSDFGPMDGAIDQLGFWVSGYPSIEMADFLWNDGDGRSLAEILAYTCVDEEEEPQTVEVSDAAVADATAVDPEAIDGNDQSVEVSDVAAAAATAVDPSVVVADPDPIVVEVDVAAAAASGVNPSVPGQSVVVDVPHAIASATAINPGRQIAVTRFGGYQTSVDQMPTGGTVYPFVPVAFTGEGSGSALWHIAEDPITNRSYVERLVMDLWLGYERDEAQFTRRFRIQWMYGFGDESASVPVSPTHDYDLKIVDDADATVFDTTTATFRQQDWGNSFRILEWWNGRNILRMVIAVSWNHNITPPTYPVYFEPEDAFIDNRCIQRLPTGVRSITVEQDSGDVTLTETDVQFSGGANTELTLNDTESSPGAPRQTPIDWDTGPGLGSGRFGPSCEGEELPIHKIGDVVGDDRGNVQLKPSDCFRIEPVIYDENEDGELRTVTVQGGAIQLNDDCDPCYDCQHVINVYEAIRRLRDKLADLVQRANAVQTEYQSAIDRFEAQRDCREGFSLQITREAYCPCRLGVAVGFCNPREECIENLVIYISFEYTDAEGCGTACTTSVPGVSGIRLLPNSVFRGGFIDTGTKRFVGREIYALNGAYPHFWATFPRVQPHQQAYVTFVLEFEECESAATIEIMADAYSPPSEGPVPGYVQGVGPMGVAADYRVVNCSVKVSGVLRPTCDE